MPTTAESPEQKQLRERREVFARWQAEIKFAQSDKAYVAWLDECDKIIRRYRDKRDDDTGVAATAQRKFNILWSNVQTLKPAIYARMPKPIVERRFMDRDPVARTASMVLERTTAFQMEVGYYHESTQKAVLDYLLPGVGQVWLRYEPQIVTQEYAEANAGVEAQEKSAEDVAEDGDGTPYETVAYEKVCCDYVYFKDFLWSAARCWEEVRWVARCSYLSRSEIAERFFDGDLEAAKRVTLDYTPDRSRGGSYEDEKNQEYLKKAAIWEIWNKPDRKVYFIAPGSPDVGCLEVADDPLKLECFWPCPEPLFTTQTNDTLLPVPDYHEYQDQAKELDDLTNRISRLTEAVKAAGVYDSSAPALARLLQQGYDNQLLPVDNWAAFAEKGGIPGAISLLPMKEIIEVLIRLYEARAQVKADLYEITGISDIVRGYSGGPAKTATEQRIKGQFASLRLEDRRAAVARFCAEAVKIIAEIASEHFSPDSLLQMSGYPQIVQDQVMKAVAAVKPPQAPQPPQGAPVDPMQAQQSQIMVQQQHQAMQQQAAQAAEQKALEEFSKAIELLRSDKLRGFRIDIETDSTVQVDAQADKEAAVELTTATFQGLGNAAPLLAQAPELIDPVGQLLMFTFRRFRVGRAMESSLEGALEQIKERLEGPRPPSPEQQKIEGELKQQQMEMQRSQQEGQIEIASKQLDMRLQQQEAALKEREMAMEARMMQLEAALKVQELKLKERELGMKMQAQVMDAQVGARKAELDMSANQKKHDLGMEALAAKTAAQKAAAKQKPKGNGGASA